MYDEEVTLAILNPAETLLGFLHPKYVDVEETIEWNGLRTIKITHPIFDDNRENLNYYNNLLAMGNKVWWNETPNGDGCLYVLLDDKTVDPATNKVTITAEEAAVELSMVPPWRFAATSRTVDATAINSYMGNLFTAGTIESIVLNYTGVISLMATLREIEKQGNKEVQFRYSYNPTTGIISRYVDIITTKGTVHTDPIEIGYNTENILLEETEADTAIAAAPCGIPSDTTSANLTKFNTVRDEFAALVVSTGTQIPLWVTKDSAGNDVNGPMVYPPYAKSASTNYVACPIADSAADYKQVQQKEKGATQYPRTVLFDSSAENKYNLYWECVEHIRAKNQPAVNLSAQVIDVPKMKGQEPEYYNAADTVYIHLPGRVNRVKARIIKTVKNPRTPEKDKLEIGNYNLNFFKDIMNIYSDTIVPYE